MIVDQAEAIVGELLASAIIEAEVIPEYELSDGAAVVAITLPSDAIWLDRDVGIHVVTAEAVAAWNLETGGLGVVVC